MTILVDGEKPEPSPDSIIVTKHTRKELRYYEDEEGKDTSRPEEQWVYYTREDWPCVIQTYVIFILGRKELMISICFVSEKGNKMMYK